MWDLDYIYEVQEYPTSQSFNEASRRLSNQHWNLHTFQFVSGNGLPYKAIWYKKITPQK